MQPIRDGAHASQPKRAGKVGAAEVLGVPLLPPGVVVAAGNRVRAGIARLHRATAPPPARILEAALGMLDVSVLATLCRLDLPDRLDRPMDAGQLADDLGVDRDRFERLLRYAATRGWVRRNRRGQLCPTKVTAFLRRAHPGGWRAWVEFAATDEVHAALQALDGGLASTGDAFADANGAPFFDWMRARPQQHVLFDAAMAAGGQMHGLVLARTLDWSKSRRVCDIGGGDGALLAVLCAQHQHLDGIILELAEVAARVRTQPRVGAVAGDAFVAVPVGFDTYLLVNILHDWDDAAATQLLARAAAALDDDAAMANSDAIVRRVVVVESQMNTRPHDDLAIRADLLMLALTPGGRERTVAEIAVLGKAAGLRLVRSRRLASGDRAHVLMRQQ